VRWLPFAILALGIMVLQTVIAPRIELYGARPDWLLALVVLAALYAEGFEVVFAAWVIGAVADLGTLDRPGLMSISYALAALLVHSGREFLFRYQALTQFAVVFVVTLAVQIGWAVYRRLMLPEAGWAGIGEVVGASLYTAAFAPLMGRGMLSMSRILGLPRRRYTYQGLV